MQAHGNASNFAEMVKLYGIKTALAAYDYDGQIDHLEQWEIDLIYWMADNVEDLTADPIAGYINYISDKIERNKARKNGFIKRLLYGNYANSRQAKQAADRIMESKKAKK